MLLPFREHLDFGPTPYDLLQEKEGIPIVRGNVVDDVTTLELGNGSAWAVLGCYLNLSNQQRTDAYVCEIPAEQPDLAATPFVRRNRLCRQRARRYDGLAG